MESYNLFESPGAQKFYAIADFISKEFPAAATQLVNSAAAAMQSYWVALAQGEAGGWGRRYANTIRFEPAKGPGSSAFVFVDENDPNAMFVHFVEEGIKSWSIKDALLAGKAAQRSQKTGVTFVRVPFRFRTPGETQASSSFAGVLPEGIYQQVMAGKVITEEIAAKAGNSNMAGLTRYTNGPHSAFMTFRTVTERSEGWIYPQKPATPIYEKVLAQVDATIEALIEHWIDNMAKVIEEKFGAG